MSCYDTCKYPYGVEITTAAHSIKNDFDIFAPLTPSGCTRDGSCVDNNSSGYVFKPKTFVSGNKTIGLRMTCADD